MGVRRAVELAEEVRDKPVYTLGPLIHNPIVLSDLEKRGIKTIQTQDTTEIGTGSTVIIRAHGIEPDIENDLRSKGASIIDATCPFVKASQLKAKELAEAGYTLFIAGDPQHAEIKGITGYIKAGCLSRNIKESYFVFSNICEARESVKQLYEKNINYSTPAGKTALIGQTTILEEEYNVIGEAIKDFFPNLEIMQTICSASSDRQNALRDLLDQVDAVIIAGGTESANTRRLFAIAKESDKPCAIVQNVSEIPGFWNYSTVGICAGASTPDSLIDEIERELFR
jgi:4-hydroxy-3-methylbut-2-enyl diphosphate reductase